MPEAHLILDPHAQQIGPEMRVNSGMQEPGETVSVAFPATGTYHVICGIHPEMRLIGEAQ